MVEVTIKRHPRPEPQQPVRASDGVDFRVTCPTCGTSRLVTPTTIMKGDWQRCSECERAEEQH